MPNKIALPSEIRNSEEEGEFPSVEIVGYTGNAVSLAGYPYYIDDPVVYNIAGIQMKDKLPYFEDHFTLLGHTIENKLEGGNVITKALHSDPGEASKTVFQRIKNGIPYQASMGLEINGEDVTYIAEGKVEVNNRTFDAPIFVVNKCRLTEMTATLSGRDGDTEVHTLSKEYEDGKAILMSVKNSTKPTSPPLKKKEAPTPVGKVDNAPVVPPQETKEDQVPAGKVDNAPAPAPNGGDTMWMLDYLDYPTLVKNARKEAWEQDRMDAEVAKLEADKIENSYRPVPGIHVVDNKVDNGYLARTAFALGVKLETIENKVGKEAAGYADRLGPMGLKEGLMLCANSNGGSFNGHSVTDVKNMNKHIKRLVVQNAFSTIDYPNIMHKVAEWKLEERWEIEAPQAPSMCKEVNNSNFRVHGHLKPKGGKMWNGLSKDGKIEHGTFGKEDKYQTELNTVAQILTFKREDIINDDMGWIQDTLDAMLEGAMMIPDYQFLNLVLNANAAGVIPTANYHTLALTATNLSTVYKAVRRRYTKKESSAGDKEVNGRFNTRWDLVVGPDLEEAAWDIIKQDRIVSNTTANTKQGDKNYWYNRLDLKVFDNFDNDSYHAGARATSWMLLPQKDTYRPFYIAYLNRQTRPITETVDLPADELGFGVRGYWDVNLGYRPVEDEKLQAFALSYPAA